MWVSFVVGGGGGGGGGVNSIRNASENWTMSRHHVYDVLCEFDFICNRELDHVSSSRASCVAKSFAGNTQADRGFQYTCDALWCMSLGAHRKGDSERRPPSLAELKKQGTLTKARQSVSEAKMDFDGEAAHHRFLHPEHTRSGFFFGAYPWPNQQFICCVICYIIFCGERDRG